jgi:hypothetical protein
LSGGIGSHGRGGILLPESDETSLVIGVWTDHIEYLILVLQLYYVYRESILEFVSQKVLGGERIALVSPIFVSSCFSV